MSTPKLHLNADEHNALNEAVKQLPSVSALRTLRDKIMAADVTQTPFTAEQREAIEFAVADARDRSDAVQVRALSSLLEPVTPEHSALYISEKLTGSTKDAAFVQAHINQAVSEAMEKQPNNAHESLADARQPAGIEGQIRHLITCVREDVLAHDGKLAARSQLAEERLKVLIALAVANAQRTI